MPPMIKTILRGLWVRHAHIGQSGNSSRKIVLIMRAGGEGVEG
ncbi:hypothetical protein C8E86_6715 [Catellatospora citrea]|nr:hypothetical protein C8E86_6715 [Catellatospora citrea]